MDLTLRERRLLELLLEHEGTTVSRDTIHREVWGYPEGVSSRSAEFTIHRLRTKLEEHPSRPRHIRDVGSGGWALSLEPPPPGASTGEPEPARGALRLDSCTVDLSGQRVVRDGEQIGLNESESSLLDRLASQMGKTVSREDLQRAIRNTEARHKERNLDSTVRELRQKIEADPAAPSHIVTVPNEGFRLEPTHDEPTEICRTNLPAESSRFVGREGDIADLWEKLARPGRLVTVLGPAGCGKTRLAHHFAALELVHRERWPGGIWWVDLAQCRTEGQLLAAIGRALDIPPDRGAVQLTRLLASLQSRGRLLLVLDNLEQVRAPASSLVEAILAGAPELLCIGTSRERLAARGETSLALPPLQPDEAAELLLCRAQALSRSWGSEPGDAPLARQIALDLDCIPLSIELAAGLAVRLSPRQLLERLEAELPSLQSAGTSGPERHASLQAAIGWSWELLDAPEQRALARMAVFDGGFSLGPAEAILGLELPVSELAAALCDRSMLRVSSPDDEGNELVFSQYRAIRDFARQRLAESGEEAALHAAQEAWYLEWGELQLGRLESLRGIEALRNLQAERANLLGIFERCDGLRPETASRIALVIDGTFRLHWIPASHAALLDRGVVNAADSGKVPLLARALAARGGKLRIRDRAAEAQADLVRAIELADAEGLQAVGADARIHLGALFLRLHRFREVGHLLDEAAHTARSLREGVLEARAHTIRGILLSDQGHFEEAVAEHRKALGGFLTAGSVLREAQGRVNLGSRYRDLGRLDESEEQFRLAMEAVERTNDLWSRHTVLSNRARTALARGDFPRAEEWFREGLAIEIQAGDRRAEAWSRMNLATIRIELGELGDAPAQLECALSLHRALSSQRGESFVLTNQGVLALIEDRPSDARTLLRDALELARTLEIRHLELIIEGYLSVAELSAGGTRLARARSLVDGESAPSQRAFLRVCTAHHALARGQTSEARKELAWAERADPSLLEQDGRILRRILKQRLMRAEAER